MRCDEAQEFVSAVYDGETVPQEAAQHMAGCAACGDLLRSYAEIGAELRSYGSLQLAEPVPERTWLTRKEDKSTWWERGWQMMRIPRIAFASLVLLLVALGSRLAVVEVRAHEDGSVLMLHLSLGSGQDSLCPLSSTDPKNQECSGVAKTDRGWFTYGVHLLRKEGGRALLAVVTDSGSRSSSYSPDEIKTLAKIPLWFSPGETLQLDRTGDQKFIATGEWTDHIPAFPIANQELDPAAHELRVTSPLLLKNSKLAGDMKGGTAIAEKGDHGVFFYLPGEGRFEFSLSPSAGAVPGLIELNRISFTSNQPSYVVITGTPIARTDKIWVTHDSSYKPEDPNLPGWIIGTL